MKIELEAKHFAECIKSAVTITRQKEGLRLSTNKDGQIFVESQTEEGYVKINVHGKVLTDSVVTEMFFEPVAMQKIVAARALITLTYGEEADSAKPKKDKKDKKGKKGKKDKKAEVKQEDIVLTDYNIYFESKNVKGKKYSGNISTFPSVIIDFIDDDKTEKEFKLSDEAQVSLATSIPHVGITTAYDDEVEMLNVLFDKSGTHVACYDQSHGAYLFNANATSKDEIRFTVPVHIFSTINKLAHANESYSIAIGSRSIKAFNDEFFISMPLYQDNEDNVALEDIIENIKGFTTGTPDATFDITRDDFFDMLSNIEGIYQAGAYIAMKAKGNNVTFSCTTGVGKINSELTTEVTGKVDVHFSMEAAMDTFNLVPGDETIKLGFNTSMGVMYAVTSIDNIESYHFLQLL